MNKKELIMDDVINYWLEKFHNTNLNEVKNLHPEWEANPEEYTRDFYAAYKVTQEQHDEWRKWLVEALMKQKKMPRKYIERSLWGIYLNSAPSVINE